MYWIFGGIAWVIGVVIAVRWVDSRLGDPRKLAVYALYAVHRKQEKFFRRYPGMREKARAELRVPRRAF